MTVLWQVVFGLLVLCVAVEGLAIVALARAIGLMQIRLGPEPAALQTADGLAIDAQAPSLSAVDLRLQRPVTLDVGTGRWALIFVTATCTSCRELVRDAGRVARDRAWDARLVVVSQGTAEQNAVLAEGTPQLTLLSDPPGNVHRAYAVESTPYAFLVEDGHIRAKGIVNHRDQLEILLERKMTQRPDILWTRVGDPAASAPALAPLRPSSDSQ